MIGALALACFVKVYGAVFLGQPRTHASLHTHESPCTMTVPLTLLAAGCAFIGLVPFAVSRPLDAVIATWLPQVTAVPINSLAPLKAIGAVSILLVGLIAILALLLAPRCRATVAAAPTWDCGYAQPTTRMQYSASSFAQMIILLFRWVLRPRVHQSSVQGIFPAPSHLRTHVDDAVLDRLLMPFSRAVERWFGWCHRFQQGLTQHYVLYILITVILMLAPLVPINEVFARLFAR
jgi:hydrogenase-4 component B